jgi:hypothetical protein
MQDALVEFGPSVQTGSWAGIWPSFAPPVYPVYPVSPISPISPVISVIAVSSVSPVISVSPVTSVFSVSPVSPVFSVSLVSSVSPVSPLSLSPIFLNFPLPPNVCSGTRFLIEDFLLGCESSSSSKSLGGRRSKLGGGRIGRSVPFSGQKYIW